jgi:hypothetical protein
VKTSQKPEARRKGEARRRKLEARRKGKGKAGDCWIEGRSSAAKTPAFDFSSSFLFLASDFAFSSGFWLLAWSSGVPERRLG